MPRHQTSALCADCGWVGPIRSDQLIALRDFDRHATDCIPREEWYELCGECGHMLGDHGRSMMHACPDGCAECSREAVAHVNTNPIRVHGTEVRYA